MCGDTSEVVPDLIEIGLDCMESCQPECMDIYRLKKLYGHDIRGPSGLTVGAPKMLWYGDEDLDVVV
jgi:uroporphyrinogen decarboxylase